MLVAVGVAVNVGVAVKVGVAVAVAVGVRVGVAVDVNVAVGVGVSVVVGIANDGPHADTNAPLISEALSRRNSRRVIIIQWGVVSGQWSESTPH